MEINAVANNWSPWTTSTRRLANRRSSRNRTTWNFEVLGRITAGDEMHRQRTGRQAGGDRSAARDQRLGHHLTAEGPNRILDGCVPKKVFSSARRRFSTASSSAKSEAAGNMSPLVVVLPDPVHMDQVGRAYCARAERPRR